jgi:hypothetical protein
MRRGQVLATNLLRRRKLVVAAIGEHRVYDEAVAEPIGNLTMPTKEKRTAAELEELIITEFKKRPEFNNILSVIVSPELPTPGGPTWECHRVSDEVTMRGSIADEIIRKLQDQFDLV